MIYLASSAQNNDDSSGDSEDGKRVSQAPQQLRPRTHRQAAGAQQSVAAARKEQQPQRVGRQVPAKALEEHPRHPSGPPLHRDDREGSQASTVSSTGAINFDWDPSFDFVQPIAASAPAPKEGGQGGKRRAGQITFDDPAVPHSSPPSAASLGLLFGKCANNKNIDVAKNYSGSANEDSHNDDDDDKDEFYDAGEGTHARGSEDEERPQSPHQLVPAPPAALHNAAGAGDVPDVRQSSSLEALGAARKEERCPAGSVPQTRRPAFKMSYGQCDNEIVDLQLPEAPVLLHGPQVFSNEGTAQADMFLPPPSKPSNTAGRRSRAEGPAASAAPPPPPHPQRTRALSDRLTSKSKTGPK